jgi:hypothetical protein
MIVNNKLIKKGLTLAKHIDGSWPTPIQLQQRCLIGLLKKAERTEFGQHYGFNNILSATSPLRAFQSEVPIHDYNKIFQEWWYRQLEGEENISWRNPVKYFALSSGTSEATSKYIPITSDMRRSMRHAALRMFACLPKYHLPPRFFTKDWLMIGGSATLNNLGHCYAGDLSGINASKPPIWVRGYYKPGTAIAKLKNWDERTKAIVELAPKWDIGVLTGIPSWVQLTLEHIIDHYQLKNIHELWPNLKVFVTGGVAFEPYKKSFESLLAHPLIYQDSYLASEGFIAFQARPGTSSMRLLLNNGIFFEFIPFDEKNFDSNGMPRPHAATLCIDEIEEGVDYALLITTNAGAWRYLIGDTVRFTDKNRSEIIITGRTKHFLSMCGEHLSVDNMNNGIREVENNLNIQIKEYTVCGVETEGHFAHHWYIGCDQEVALEALAYYLDEALKKINDDYASERAAMLRPPKISLVHNEVFYDWQRHIGRMNGQSKIPRVMKQEQFADWTSFVLKKTDTNA